MPLTFHLDMALFKLNQMCVTLRNTVLLPSSSKISALFSFSWSSILMVWFIHELKHHTVYNWWGGGKKTLNAHLAVDLLGGFQNKAPVARCCIMSAILCASWGVLSCSCFHQAEQKEIKKSIHTGFHRWCYLIMEVCSDMLASSVRW